MQSSNYNQHGLNAYGDKLLKAESENSQRGSNRIFQDDYQTTVNIDGRASQKFYEHPMVNII